MHIVTEVRSYSRRILVEPSFVRFLKLSSTIGWNNVQPRSNMARLKDNQKLDQATRDRLARMIGAHEVNGSPRALLHTQYVSLTQVPSPSLARQNGMESLPLWIGAVLAGYTTSIPHSTLNTFAVGYVGLRLLYNFIYINQTTEAVGNLRSMTFAGLSLPLTLLIKSANKVAATGSDYLCPLSWMYLPLSWL
ncbi:uncharacterized protein PHACADRAFT_206558 [Phanerochaete carnosa HHB-10118-sp]|uniref:Uncharacterized protein n=1 Tax=Phanerochaete carnosa (strain HHB-10118-sp) TaxID=650164 RepID=K5W1E4_PHACS|nr:uncharacterized protein PHACADRAFT_206558 [Phanerochaete carnosa HHB-10118-sp]EKM57678.1 hypothetical protein PHACADRAFT_206558 [Phanerochaete carnosa HHB-10118-sp]